MKEKVLKCLTDACPDIDFEGENKLVDEGILDSLSMMQIIASLMDTFEIDIDADDIITENFNSFSGLYNMVIKKLEDFTPPEKFDP